jgi:glycerophosphoryl diester phosphodiesterase
MLCIAHRGAMGHAPENTLLAVERALALGAPWLEVDVQLADGQLVVIHDRRLERTTNGRGLVADQSFVYLRSLDAGAGQRIPTLAEVFALVNRRAGINVELKGAGTALPVARFLQEQFDNDWSTEQVLVSSFNHPELLILKQQLSSVRLGALLYGIPLDYAACGERLGAYSVNPGLDFVSQELVDDAHRRGLKVFVYTVDQPDDLAQMQALGVDGVFSNYPERVLVLSRL